jgi:hypothetical protein
MYPRPDPVQPGAVRVSRTLVPRLALSAPQPRTRLVSRHPSPSQFPLAHRPSLPRARMPGPCPGRAPPVGRSGPARPASQPAGPLCLHALFVPPPESQRSRGSSRDCPEPQASGRHHPQPGLRSAKRPPPRHRVRQEQIPTQARASATGYEHRPLSCLVQSALASP